MTLGDDIIPHKGHFTSLQHGLRSKDSTAKQRVVVVAVFGKSGLDSGGCKAAALELMVGRKIFQRDMTHPIAIDEETMTGVEGYYDPDRRAIYLHLTGAYDTAALISALETMHQQLQEKGFLMAWSSLKLAYARSLLVLFSVSHLLLLCHPTHVFDISYIHLFRTLDAIRSKAQNYIAETLRLVPGISKDWVSFGRLCAPRVLFIFSSHLLPAQIRSGQDNSAVHRSMGGHRSYRTSPPSPLRNLELALEDQIYRLLRKSRVITNISANSLFALPSIYIMEEGQEEVPAASLINDTLHNLCSASDSNLSSELSQLTIGSSNKPPPQKRKEAEELLCTCDESQLRHWYVSFCNCGRRQGQREDPFSTKAANYTFYEQLSETCCSRLDTISFPTFKSSVIDAKAANVNGSESEEIEADTISTVKRESREQQDSETPHTPGLSLVGTGLSGSMNSTTGTAAARMTGDPAHIGSQVVITLTKDDTKTITKDRGIIRQASTTEYLPGMLHTNSPAGLLPRWSSWSLCCLGPSSLYSHNAGICDQPGFLPGTNFLLPWDVTVKIEDRNKWPAIADTLGKKALLLKNKKNRVGDIHEFSVKIFLGVEYECVRGHRFMMATPDRHLKASPSGLVKAMPPRLQMLICHSTSHVPAVKLSASAYWVLRLPYVYVGEQGPHYLLTLDNQLLHLSQDY
ncbi:putative protein SMG8 isoform X2 [Penaeus vannamei]|uniref:Nonsense-mediated mRNA decay factor SMG8 n=1 Tax=Penaeus vannamei TaxID=6689 RepID=A0A423U0I9_PENVA|nr:putative protein SMG8 isoform X2 [Penaeus vannamei]